MARVLVLGADGMVGHIARIYLSEAGHEVFSVARTASADWVYLDVENEVALLAHIARTRPDVVLNCVGILIKDSDQDPERATRLNSLLPRVLSRMGPSMGYRHIHISSDCVFAGNAGPYSEGDRRDADDVYGRTKALGEINNDRDLTIRTSKIGPELKPGGAGLFSWFMSQQGTVKGFTKVLWGGVTTLELAKAVDAAIKGNVTGLVHLTNGVAISKYDLLSLFKEIWGRENIAIEGDGSKASDRSLVCSRKDFKYRVPAYRTMLDEMKSFMITHRQLYSFYE